MGDTEDILFLQRVMKQISPDDRRLILALTDAVVNATPEEEEALEKARQEPDREKRREKILQVLMNHEIVDDEIRHLVMQGGPLFV